MFDQKPGGVEDIFDDAAPPAGAPTAGVAGNASSGGGTPAVVPSSPEVSAGILGFLRGKLLWVILGGSVLVVLIGGGAYLALRGGSVTPPSAPLIAEPQKPREPAPAPEPQASPEAAAPVAVPTPALTDTDRDGISDADEASYGTNPLSADTDNDGLSDVDEIRVYKTNPLVPDTDGDGFLDGAEVKAGYDPNGKGKLQDLNKALQK